MKCPKCGYLGFEDVDRCRNCGYDFSLAAPPIPELSLRDSREVEPSVLDDLELLGRAAAEHVEQSSQAAVPGFALDGVDEELPLFGTSGRADAGAYEDDTPLIRRTSPPRPPLSVRRATPEIPRLRTPVSRTPMLDLSAFETEAPVAAHSRPWHAAAAADESAEIAGAEPASTGARMAAAAVDIVILLAIDAVVVYLTMQICGITLAELSLIPKAPMLAFLLAQNLGYFIGFNVGGQTLGKMATGIKVVSAGSESTPDFGHSVLRTLVWVVLAVPAGLGFVTALFGRERRGLHDRCAGTKVVRATT